MKESMMEDILDSIIVNNAFDNLIYLKPENYHLMGIPKDASFIGKGWEVYVDEANGGWYFLYHPKKEIVSMRFDKFNFLYPALKSGLFKTKKKTILGETKGLGDVVKKIAQPIAKGIDAVAGTDIQNCSSCEKRRQALNKMFSFNKSMIQ
jgi:hypothetical protein